MLRCDAPASCARTSGDGSLTSARQCRRPKALPSDHAARRQPARALMLLWVPQRLEPIHDDRDTLRCLCASPDRRCHCLPSPRSRRHVQRRSCAREETTWCADDLRGNPLVPRPSPARSESRSRQWLQEHWRPRKRLSRPQQAVESATQSPWPPMPHQFPGAPRPFGSQRSVLPPPGSRPVYPHSATEFLRRPCQWRSRRALHRA